MSKIQSIMRLSVVGGLKETFQGRMSRTTRLSFRFCPLKDSPLRRVQYVLGAAVCVCMCILLCKKGRKNKFQTMKKGGAETKVCQTVLENVCVFVEGVEGGVKRRLHNLSWTNNMWFPCRSGLTADRRKRKPLIHLFPKIPLAASGRTQHGHRRK